MMDGFKLQYKQSQSFGLSNNDLSGDFANRSNFPRYDANGDFKILDKIKIHTENNQTETASSFGSLVGTLKYYGGSYSPLNNSIYLVPFLNRTDVLKINCETDTGTLFGNLGAGIKYTGSVFAGGFIWGIPYDVNNFCKIDPSNDTVTTISPVGLSGTGKFVGAVLAPNNKIYCAPENANYIGVYDYSINHYYTIPIPITGSSKYRGAVLAGDYVYFIPHSTNRVLKLCWKDDSFIFLSRDFTSSSGKWIGGCVTPNYKIVCAPFNSTTVLEIDVLTDELVTYGSLGADTQKWSCPTLASNGYIYCAPVGLSVNHGWLRIDPIKRTTLEIGSYAAPDVSYGAVLAKNGKIYGTFTSSTSIPTILSNLPNELDLDFVANRHFNKF